MNTTERDGDTDSPETSPSLLIRIRDPDDVASWNVFQEVYSPIVKAYCRRRGIQPSDIDDISQEVMTAISTAIRKFEYQPQRGKFRSWLATITANKLKDLVAANKKYRDELPAILEQLSAAPELDSQWTTLFLNQVFDAACDRIRSQCESITWQCFEKTWFHDASATDVADELGIPVHTVYVNKSRILKKLESEFLMLSDDFPIAELKSIE